MSQLRRLHCLPHPLRLPPLIARQFSRVHLRCLYQILLRLPPQRMHLSKFIHRVWLVGRHRGGVSHRLHVDRPLQRQDLCQFSPPLFVPRQSPSANFYQSALVYSAHSGCDPVAQHLYLQPMRHPRVVILTGHRGVAQHHVGDAWIVALT